MAKVTTLDKILQPLMEGCSVYSDYCVICGRRPVQMHHIVRRSAGNMYVNGVRLHRPKIALCGLGNTSGCHGLAHQNRLHFRWVRIEGRSSRPHTFGSGHWEYLVTDEPVKYSAALKMDGWLPIHTP